MAVPTLGGESLGKVETISPEKFQDIFQVSTPTHDSDQTVLEELSGATRTITVKGIMTGSSVADLKTNLDAINDLIDGDQGGTVAFVSDITGTVNVVIAAFSFMFTTATRVTADYTLELIEGTWSS